MRNLLIMLKILEVNLNNSHIFIDSSIKTSKSSNVNYIWDDTIDKYIDIQL